MPVDYHTHSERCGHATGTMEQYVDRAIATGLKEIGLTDHLYLYFQEPDRRDASFAMPEDLFESHHREMLELRDRYRNRIGVRVSVEADYFDGFETRLHEILAQYEFDYVLGSVHFLGNWPLDSPSHAGRYEETSVAGIYTAYFLELQKAVRSGAFDVLAHFDLPKKFGFHPERDLTELVGETLDLVAAHGLAVELSTAGLRKPAGELYPSMRILREMKRRGIPITLASDAHSPDEVAAGYEHSLRAAFAAGYTSIATFRARERRMVPLP